MTYEVRCECGKAHAVSSADAGSSLRCACGRSVDVPPLHQLRTTAGEEGVSPSMQLQAMLHRNELPGTRNCACCLRETDHLIRVSVVCEQVIVSEKGSAGAALLGGMLFGLLAGLAAMVISRAGQQPVQHGTQVSFILPVRVCETCARSLTTTEAIRKALSTTAIYEALFEQYPKASIERLG